MEHVHTIKAAIFSGILLLSMVLISPFSIAQGVHSLEKNGGSQQSSPAPDGKRLLWRMQRDSTVVYIMGSMHALPKEFYPLDNLLERAFDSSDVLVLELKMDSSSMPAIIQELVTRGKFSDDQTLKGSLSPETYSLLEQRFQSLGLPIAKVEKLKPWAVNVLLSHFAAQKANLEWEMGVEQHFIRRAESEHKRMMALETAQVQIDVFDKMPIHSQEALLRATLEDEGRPEEKLKVLATAWRRADFNGLQELIDGTKKDSILYQHMLVDRNNAWVPQIEGFLNEKGRYLVVVGTAHLIGDDSVIELLRRKGYRLEQM